jgi:hypothetical protein
VIVLLVMTDGRRDCVARTLSSAIANLEGPITRVVIHDDSADPDHRAWLQRAAPDAEVVWHYAGRQGFGGAIRNAWKHVAAGPERFVFHLEDDFTFNGPVDLAAMAEVLDDEPHLVQLALRRQPWNDAELAAGGIVEQHPTDYIEATDHAGRSWLEHRRFFTTNPSLYRRALCASSWPEGAESEGRFTHQLLADPEVGFWGARDSGEAVTHIGDQRAGVGY